MLALQSIYFIVGALFGSFLNVLIYRMPRKMPWKMERSACPHCKKLIPWYHNIPVLSFLILRGKCSTCPARIPWSYFFNELFLGAAAVWLGPTILTPERLALFFFLFSTLCVFVTIFFIDLEHQIIPDELNLFLGFFFLIYSIFFFQYDWKHWLLGGLFGFSSTYLVTWVHYKIRGVVGLGGGDIKLFGVLGILLGVQGILINIYFSCFFGAIFTLLLIFLRRHKASKHIAFGPFIILVSFVQIFFPDFTQRILNLLF